MHLVCVGLNHRTAPIEVRERLAVSDTRLPQALASLAARRELAEAAILSTCNRMEVYAALPHPSHESALVRHLSEQHDVAESNFTPHLYTHRDDAAVQHLFRVASGLDSLVLGEAQILRQVRDAFAAAEGAGSMGALLNGLFRAAIAVGRRARTETDIGRGGFSVGHAAVDLARSIFGSLDGATILILGAGKMSELTAKHLVASGVRVVFVANRTFERAASLAERLSGQAIQYDEFPARMQAADVVISSTAAPHPIVDRDLVAPVMRKRRGRPLFLIDIAVPRDIAPEVGDLDNVFLYDVDDLQGVVAEMARGRAGEAARVEAIVGEEAAKFAAWWRSLDAAPVVAQLKAKQEAIREDELRRLRNQLPELSDRTWKRIEAATRSMMNRMTRDPVVKLKEAAEASEAGAGHDIIGAARSLFALDEDRCPARHDVHDDEAPSLAESQDPAAVVEMEARP